MKQATKIFLKSQLIAVFVLSAYTLISPGEKMPAHKSMAAAGVTGALNKGEIAAKVASLAVPFVRNAGQFNVEVKYAADLFSGRFFLTRKELVYSLLTTSHQKGARPDRPAREMEPQENLPGQGLAFREFFVDKKGNKIDFAPTGENRAETEISYFRGSDAGKWRSGVAAYQSVSLGEVYAGVEVKLKASGKNVEKIFYVSPRGDAARIKIGVTGVDGLKVAEDGRLLFKNSLGELAMRKPIAWQEIAGRRREVKVGYRLLENHLYGFAVSGDYAKDSTLIIDPNLDTLMASTILGGMSSEYVNSMALDSSGNVYVAGVTGSPDFPTTEGAYNRNLVGWTDFFVSKLNSSLTSLLASTFLGGDRLSISKSMVLDSCGDVYMTGWTESTNFPTTCGAYSRNHNGKRDAIVAKLDGSLTKLLASSYLGGAEDEMGNALALDHSGNVYLVGDTGSGNFPTTCKAFQKSYGGGHDAYVSKLNGSLTTLLASTYMGGWISDDCFAIALDRSGNVHVAGNTGSHEFPTTPGAYQRAFLVNGIFISELDGTLSTLRASTFLDSSDGDFVRSLVLDGSDNVYVAGITNSADFPTTEGAYDQSYKGNWDVFVSKLDRGLTSLLGSTLLGGSNEEYFTSMTLDDHGDVVVTGRTESANFPTTASTIAPAFNGFIDGFVAKLNENLTTLLSSTYLGGKGYDIVECTALDREGNIYAAGHTESADFPTTERAYDRIHHGFTDAFVTKLNNTDRITIVSQKGGEILTAGTTYPIAWLKQGNLKPNVKIVLCQGANTLVRTITSTTPNDGAYDWLVPMNLATGNNYFVRVSTVDNLVTGDSDRFSIIVPTITVTSPFIGSVWAKNTSKAITWNKFGDQDTNVRIQLFRGTTKALDIKLNTPNSGSYEWAIPATLANALYTIRITTLDGKVQGVSKNFTIARGMIRVLAPAVGARWQRGATHAITWSGEGVLNANVKIQLLKGDQVSAIAATTANDGSFDWTIPANKALANYRIRVVTADNLVRGESGIFAITGSVE